MVRPLKSSPFFEGLCASLLCLCVVRLLVLGKAFSSSPHDVLPTAARPGEQNTTLAGLKRPIRRARVIPDYIDTEKAGLYRFEEVNGFLGPSDQLYRSSAPFYDKVSGDASQQAEKITRDALKQRGIKTVISLNSQATNPKFRDVFKDEVFYKAVPVEDFSAPTPKQLQQITDIYMHSREKGGVLIWCGYGHGRTGTAISAIQIRLQAELPDGKGVKLTHADFNANHVETEKQLGVLDDYQREVQVPCGG
ncbi:putative heat-labile enterotoxin [Ophiocordyceps camponoti-saundersi (nom. inval.)]|nr:putative heat-labile enterotoxin [Ophiocordyceps camponoti-saundersi (nom. inval.)]